MRILIWTDAFWPEIGGMEVFCMRLVTALCQRGHECLVITDDRTRSLDADFTHYGKTPIRRFPFRDLLMDGDLGAVRATHEAIGAVVDEFAPDLIHANAHQSSIFFFVRQQKRRHLPAVLTLHDNALLGPRKSLGASVLAHADALVAISLSIRDQVVAHEAELAQKLHVIINALPVPALPPEPLPWPPRVLAFGRVVKEKGFDLAIEAFAQVASSFPEATFTLAGDGVETDRLRDRAQELQLHHRIHFPGWVDPEKIPELLNQHTLVIMPSRWQEPFGLVALQSAQMGRPVIGSISGAIPEIVLDGVTGKLFENENVGQLAASLRLLLRDRGFTEQLGRQAREQALERFDFDLFIRDYESLYEKVLNA